MNDVGLADETTVDNEDFPAWWENYAEGIPAFAQKYRNILDEFPTHFPSTASDHIAATAAMVFGHTYLFQDITQTLLDRYDGAFSVIDTYNAIALETMEAVYNKQEIVFSDNPMDSQIQYAVVVALNPANDLMVNKVPEHKSIRKLVGLIKILGSIM